MSARFEIKTLPIGVPVPDDDLIKIEWILNIRPDVGQFRALVRVCEPPTTTDLASSIVNDESPATAGEEEEE